MKPQTSYKNKIVNDPIYGFISFRYTIIQKLIDHPWFQRLRRISQLGLSHLVYPGAVHNRFQHAVGAMFLMQSALDTLRLKGHSISEEEEQGALIAILLHDVGHGPFSHTLEHSLVMGMNHEELSVLIMERLNAEYDGALTLGIQIFKNEYSRKFFHQMVSSQLDMDRLDYLLRDSFYSGVMEGKIGSERIIKMLNVVDDQLVVEEKGIYSIEKFLVSRRLMYWQVYLHKTVISAEFMLVSILNRARELAEEGKQLFCSPALEFFLYNKRTKEEFESNPEVISQFIDLDDSDIMGAIKVWQYFDDKILSLLCGMMVNRNLLKIRLNKDPFSESEVDKAKQKAMVDFGLTKEESSFLVINEMISNRAYDKTQNPIQLLFKNGIMIEASAASDHLNLEALSVQVDKWFLCYPKLT